MKRIFTAIASTILLAAIPAQATTFSTLTIIYAAAGAADSASPLGTSVPCINQSGLNATVRVVFFDDSGVNFGSATFSVAQGRTLIVGTASGTSLFSQNVM